MIPATFVKGLLSPGTQKILRSSHVFKREASFDGLLVQCTLLKRPPEGGAHNDRSNISSSYNSSYTNNTDTTNSIFYWATPDECEWVGKEGSRALHSLYKSSNGSTTATTITTTTPNDVGRGGEEAKTVPPHLTMITGIIRMSPCESKRINGTRIFPAPIITSSPLRVTIQLSGEASAWVRTTEMSSSICLHHSLCSPNPRKSAFGLGESNRSFALFGCCELVPLYAFVGADDPSNHPNNGTRTHRVLRVRPPAIVAVSAHYPNISVTDLAEAFEQQRRQQQQRQRKDDKPRSSTSSTPIGYSAQFVCGSAPGSIRKVTSSSVFPNFVSDTPHENRHTRTLHMKLNVFLL